MQELLSRTELSRALTSVFWETESQSYGEMITFMFSLFSCGRGKISKISSSSTCIRPLWFCFIMNVFRLRFHAPDSLHFLFANVFVVYFHLVVLLVNLVQTTKWYKTEILNKNQGEHLTCLIVSSTNPC